MYRLPSLVSFFVLPVCLAGWLGGFGAPIGYSIAAAESEDVHAAEFYVQQIKPVLAERCFACHGVLKQEGGLRLDTADFMKRGGDSGSSIESSDPKGSLLLERIAAQDASQRMPPEGEPLKPSQIEAVEKWLSAGALAPEDEEPEKDPAQHWAFVAPEKPHSSRIPTPSRFTQSANPIDSMLEDAMASAGLEPVPAADKGLWLRRVTMDVIGLPPTQYELKAFLEDDTAEADLRVIDRLLSSPHYGERWGRHWMDIWRYSDWWGLGAEVRNSQKHIWHWRDWIIESLNEDKSYDQMILEMLAADELYPLDANRLRANGFLARQYFKFNRTSWMDETIEHTAKSMLGLTMNCAKCHDHKYDPISQENYYQMRAIFEPYQVRMDRVGDEFDLQKDGIPRAFDCNAERPTYLHIRGDEKRPDESKPIAPNVPTFLQKEHTYSVASVSLPLEAAHPELQADVVALYQSKAEQAVAKAQTAVELARSQATKLLPATGDAPPATDEFPAIDAPIPQPATESTAPPSPIPSDLAIAELELQIAQRELDSIPLRHAADRERWGREKKTESSDRIASAAKSDREIEKLQAELQWSRNCKELAGLTDEKKRAEVQKKIEASAAALDKAKKQLDAPGVAYRKLKAAEKIAESNVESEDSRNKPFPQESTGRRTALARWITDTKNPLTARVAVNHIWARHFGVPLVSTVFDFGRKGASPTHPELLDYLAVEFMEEGWSMKKLHRKILSSKAYRRSASPKLAGIEAKRSDPENRYLWRMNSIRMESQSVRDSLLSLAGSIDLQMGGPSIPAKDAASTRRSIYFFHSHNEHHPFLSVFDDASVLDCYRRASSIVPQQALALENSQLAQEMAVKITERLEKETRPVDDESFAREAFRLLLAYEPNTEELASVHRFIAAYTAASAEDAQREWTVRAALVLSLLNHNDFITVR